MTSKIECQRAKAKRLLHESGLDDGCLCVVYEGEFSNGSS